MVRVVLVQPHLLARVLPGLLLRLTLLFRLVVPVARRPTVLTPHQVEPLAVVVV